MRNPLRRLSALILGTAVAVSLAACSSDDSDDAAVASGDAAFPVTVDHVYGSETIEKEPERIVSLADGALDPLLSLGLEPVASSDLGNPDENLPWISERVTWPMDVSKDSPEEVANYSPDLIIVGAVDKPVWEKLEAIAPTIAVKTNASKSNWHSYLPPIAAATGNSDKVGYIEDDYDRQVSEFRESIPGIDELTYNGAARVGKFIYASQAVMQDMGLTMEENQAGLDLSAEISDENINLLKGDVLVIFDPMGQRKDLEKNTAFMNLPAVKSGSVIWQDKALGFALSNSPGPLSFEWLTEKIRPQLQAAIDAKK